MKEKELVDYGCRFLEYREAVRPMLKETKEILGEEYKLPKKYTNLVDRYNRLSDQLEEVEDQLNAYSRVQLQKLIEKCNEHLPEGFEVVHGYSSWYDGRGGFWARIADVRPEEVQRLERSTLR